MDRKVILVGGFHEIIELCEELGYIIVGIIDNNIKTAYLDYPIIGTDDEAGILFDQYGNIPLIITPDLPSIREKLYKLYSGLGYKFETVVSTAAKVSKSADIGVGTIIQHGVNISSFTKIGNFVKLNTGCNVMHDCCIGNFVTVAPNAVILGRTNIGNKTYIGANATLLPDKTVGENVIVGAGAVVTKNISPNLTIKGIPAR